MASVRVFSKRNSKNVRGIINLPTSITKFFTVYIKQVLTLTNPLTALIYFLTTSSKFLTASLIFVPAFTYIHTALTKLLIDSSELFTAYIILLTATPKKVYYETNII